MLATILKTSVATKVSIDIMDAFLAMRCYIDKNEYRLTNVETKLIGHNLEIKLLHEPFDKLEEKRKVNEIYFSGQIYDAYFKVQEIFNNAKSELIIIDAYADNTILDIIKRIYLLIRILLNIINNIII